MGDLLQQHKERRAAASGPGGSHGVDGVILAAGLSTRMGRNKLLLPYKGKPLLQHTIDLAASLPLRSVILVSRPDNLPHIRVPEPFIVRINERGEEGQSLSMRLGLEAAHGDAYLFFQGDQPLLDRAKALAVLERATREHIIVPSYRGAPGNPVCFPACFRAELLAATGDAGGRGVRDAHPEACVYVPFERETSLLDVDTPEQYRTLLEGTVP